LIVAKRVKKWVDIMDLHETPQLSQGSSPSFRFQGRRVFAGKILAYVAIAFTVGALLGWLGPKIYLAEGSKVDKGPLTVWVSVRSADFRRVTGATLWLGDEELGRTDAFGIWQGEIPRMSAKKFRLLAKKGEETSEAKPIEWTAESNKAIKISLLLSGNRENLDPTARTEAILDWEFLLPLFPEALMTDQSLLQNLDLQFSSRFAQRDLRSWAEKTQARLLEDLLQDGNKVLKGARHLIVVSPVEGSRANVDSPMVLIEGFHRSQGEKTRIYSFLDSLDLDAKAISHRIRLGLDRLMVKPSFVYREKEQLLLSIPIYWAKSWSVGAQAKVFVAGAWRSLKQPHSSGLPSPTQSQLEDGRPLQVKPSEGLCPGVQPCPALVMNGPALELNASEQRYWIRVPKGIVDPEKDVLYVAGYPALRGRTNGMYTFVSNSLGTMNVAILRSGDQLVYRGKIDVRPGRVANLGPASISVSKAVKTTKALKVAKKESSIDRAKMIRGKIPLKQVTSSKPLTSAKLSKSLRSNSPKRDRL
jgi:hypothetical protein